jgi:predicted O-methyltransferase YrrM
MESEHDVVDVMTDAYRNMVYKGIQSNGPAQATSANMVHGWENPGFRKFLQYAIMNLPQEPRPIVVIELGSWLGRSTNLIAAALKTSKAPAGDRVIAVDTWLGSAEHWTTMQKTIMPKLARRNGYPSMYYTFLSIAKMLGNDDVIVPLPLPTQQAVHVLTHQGVKADLIYVDAAHDEPSVYADITAYWDLLREGGYMIGDDWEWPGVRAAVERFCKEKQELKLMYEGGVWCVRK